jgi:DNA invertase Pin-like site-specific DNA recombinase
MKQQRRQIVSYLRVSTQRQGASGLGLEAQRAAVQAYCRESGAEVAREFVEVESGKRDDRPVLAKALAHAKKTGTVLVVSKLDRLGRRVSFLSKLLESDVEIYFCDQPGATRMVLHIMAAIAEGEAKAIGDRTKAALAAAKAGGALLGASNPRSRNLDGDARQRGAHANKVKARAAYGDVLPTIRALKAQGVSFQGIADKLNAEEHTTRSGKAWSAAQVRRALLYAENPAASPLMV